MEEINYNTTYGTGCVILISFFFYAVLMMRYSYLLLFLYSLNDYFLIVMGVFCSNKCVCVFRMRHWSDAVVILSTILSDQSIDPHTNHLFLLGGYNKI